MASRDEPVRRRRRGDGRCTPGVPAVRTVRGSPSVALASNHARARTGSGLGYRCRNAQTRVSFDFARIVGPPSREHGSAASVGIYRPLRDGIFRAAGPCWRRAGARIRQRRPLMGSTRPPDHLLRAARHADCRVTSAAPPTARHPQAGPPGRSRWATWPAAQTTNAVVGGALYAPHVPGAATYQSRSLSDQIPEAHPFKPR